MEFGSETVQMAVDPSARVSCFVAADAEVI